MGGLKSNPRPNQCRQVGSRGMSAGQNANDFRVCLGSGYFCKVPTYSAMSLAFSSEVNSVYFSFSCSCRNTSHHTGMLRVPCARTTRLPLIEEITCSIGANNKTATGSGSVGKAPPATSKGQNGGNRGEIARILRNEELRVREGKPLKRTVLHESCEWEGERVEITTGEAEYSGWDARLRRQGVESSLTSGGIMISSPVWCGRRAQLNSGERIEMNYYRHLCSEHST